MSAAFHVRASVVEEVPGGALVGDYKQVHREVGAAINDFLRLIPCSEDVELRYSS